MMSDILGNSYLPNKCGKWYFSARDNSCMNDAKRSSGKLLRAEKRLSACVR